MLSLFALRLGFGCVACLFLLAPRRSARAQFSAGRPNRSDPTLVHPNFFRTLLLTILGLECLALMFLLSFATTETRWGFVGLGLALAGAFVGSVVWSLERSPGAVLLLLVTTVGAGLALAVEETNAGMPSSTFSSDPFSLQVSLQAIVGGFASAAVLGSALTAMLLGHSYLIAPGMSLVPLLRLLGVLAVALVARLLLDVIALAQTWNLQTTSTDVVLWLPVRWLVGFLIPAVLLWMAWQTARIRSTQSATGILYVVVICCFLGELTALLLRTSGTTW